MRSSTNPARTNFNTCNVYLFLTASIKRLISFHNTCSLSNGFAAELPPPFVFGIVLFTSFYAAQRQIDEEKEINIFLYAYFTAFFYSLRYHYKISQIFFFLLSNWTNELNERLYYFNFCFALHNFFELVNAKRETNCNYGFVFVSMCYFIAHDTNWFGNCFRAFCSFTLNILKW